MKKKTNKGEFIAQMLRLILYSSVALNFVFNAAFEAFLSGSDKLPRYTGICLIILIYFAAAAFAYGKLCKKLSYRLAFSAFFIFFWNTTLLVLIWEKYGTGSFLFKSSRVLVILSLIVFAGDLLYFISSAAKWKETAENEVLKPEKSGIHREPAGQAEINAAELPGGMLKRTNVFFPAVCLFLGLWPIYRLIPDGPFGAPSVMDFMFMVPLVPAAAAVVYKLYTKILSLDKYIIHKPGEEEEGQ
ncbi:MAG: hypothetical protein LUD81_01530 [Clostridiales bacterium]|nr:hypothetical protein [Clostridiales bacterium]